MSVRGRRRPSTSPSTARLSPGGTLVTLEVDPEGTAIARLLLCASPVDDRVDSTLLTVGDGLLVVWKRAAPTT